MRPPRVCALVLLIAALPVVACGSSSSSSSSTATPAASSTATDSATTAAPGQGAPGPEGIPLELGPALAPASSTAPGTTVDGIRCQPNEQLVYHIHSHLQVYVDGQSRSLPGGIGLIEAVAQQSALGPFYGASRCVYWLHTHATDGIIHIESPSVRIYTLGNFFNEWRQPLSRTQVAGATGKVTAFVDGKRWTRDPRAIQLLPHAVIQLDVGSPVVPPGSLSWTGASL